MSKNSKTLHKFNSAEYNNFLNEINKLINDLENKNHSYIKTASGSSPRLHSNFSTEDWPELKPWYKLLDDYDKPAWRWKAMDAFGQALVDILLAPLERDKEQTEQAVERLQDDNDSTRNDLVWSDEHNNFVRRKDLNSESSLNNALIKTALLTHDFNTNLNILKKAFDTTDSDIFLERPRPSGHGLRRATEAERLALRAATKSPGRMARIFPWIGIAFSLPLTVKNTVEAFNNGKAILFELPFEKYGINKFAAAGGPAFLPHLNSAIPAAIEDNKENPENLYEILEICKTIPAFWIDVVFIVSNIVALILDIIALVTLLAQLGWFVPGPGWLVAIAGLGAWYIGAGLTILIVATEIWTDWKVNQIWNRKKELIKEIAVKKVRSLEYTIGLEEVDAEEDEEGSSEDFDFPEPLRPEDIRPEWFSPIPQ